MTEAVQAGFPKAEIEKVATARQARVDSAQQVIVGVNKFKPAEATNVEVLEVDNSAVREAQIARLEKIRSTRDQAACEAALHALKQAASSDQGNLLALSVEAMRARASVGEVSDALEAAFGRYQASTKVVQNIYANAYGDESELAPIATSLSDFTDTHGETPLLYMAKLGQDGHDRGAKVVASAFGDFGLDIKMGTLFETPEEAVKNAISEGAHIIGVSSLAAGHKTLIPALIQALKDQDAEDIVVICGGIIPHQDYAFLHEAGVAAIFGPGTPVTQAAKTTIDATNDHLKRMHNYRQARLNKQD